MEKVISLNTEYDDKLYSRVDIDNSTAYKDFSFRNITGEEIQVTIYEKEKQITIGLVTLNPLETELFIRFVNQIKQ